jgi:hypothetical protein
MFFFYFQISYVLRFISICNLFTDYSLCHTVVGNIADVSEVYAASMFRVEA